MSLPLRNTGFIAFILGITFSFTAYANTPVDYAPGEALHFQQHASSLSAQLSPVDAEEVLQNYLNDNTHWVAPADRKPTAFINPGYQWQRLTLHNPLDKTVDLYLEHSEASLTKGDFTLVRADGSTQNWQLGTVKPFAERPVPYRLYLMPFELAPQETITLLVGYDGWRLSKSTQVIEREQFWINSTKNLVGDGMYFGTELLIAFLVLLMYSSNRDPIYLYFCMIGLGNLFYLIMRDGYAFQYLWPSWPSAQNELLLMGVNLSTIGAILFSKRFLRLSVNKGCWLYHTSNVFLGWNLVLLGIILLASPGAGINWSILTIFLSLLYFVTIWLYTLLSKNSWDSREGFYAIAWLLYFSPKILATVYGILWPDEQIPVWALSRNGELLFTIALYSALLLEFRRTHMRSRALELESATRNKMLTTISHELRTPLNGIIGSAELLSHTELSHTQRHYSDSITNSGTVLLKLINDTLDLAKVNESELVLEHAPFNLDRVLSDSAATFLYEVERRTLPIYIHLGPDVPLKLLGDEFRLRQVLLNLLGNAVKFTRAGSINVHVSAAKLAGSNSMITVVVKDTGIGIAAESLNRIFEPFGQAEASTTRQFGGSGLGLTICKSILERMGGTISVVSEEGVGSQFTFSVPLEIDTESEVSRLAGLEALKNKRVLALSDVEGFFDPLLPNLRGWGLDIDLASDLSTARSRVSSKPYDALIAFYFNSSNNVELLENLRLLNTNTLLLHHSSINTEPTSAWEQKFSEFAIPAGLQEIADAIIRVLDADKTEVDTAPGNARSEFPNDSDALVLVVEDNATNQMVTVGMLEHLGFKPDVADDGEEACRMAQEKHYGLILMDCDLPVMDGYQASRNILGLKQDPPPCIVALTADAQDSNLPRCQEAGMRDVLHKPLGIAELKAYLERLRLELAQ